MSTLGIVVLLILAALYLMFWIGDRIGAETHTISTRDLPNTAPDLHANPRTVDTSG